MYCPKCGKDVGGARFCNACGTEIPQRPGEQSPTPGQNASFPADWLEAVEPNSPLQLELAPAQRKRTEAARTPPQEQPPFGFPLPQPVHPPQPTPRSPARPPEQPPQQWKPYSPGFEPNPVLYGPPPSDPPHKKKKRTLIIVLAAVLVLLLLAGGTAALYFTGRLPFGPGKVPATDATAAKTAATVLRIDGSAYDEALFDIAYGNAFIRTVSRRDTSDAAPFDPVVDAAAQQYETGRTYHDYFTDCAVETLEEFDYYAKEAAKAGITLLPENREKVDQTLEDFRGSAERSDVDPDALTAALFGPCVTLEKYEEYLTADALAQQMRDSEEARVREEITEEEIRARLEEDKWSYLMADVRMLGIKKSGTAMALAEELLSQISNESTFISVAKKCFSGEGSERYDMENDTLFNGMKYGAAQKTVSSGFADWLFNGDRRVNDKRIWENDKTVYVVLVTKTAYTEERPLADVRTILIPFGDAGTGSAAETGTVIASDGSVLTNEGTGRSLATVLKTYEIARGILDEYLQGKQTEEAFAALADANGGTGGGLYESVLFGQTRQPFEEWVYTAGRRPGETGLVMTADGWNVMYFVRHHEQGYWREAVTDSLVRQKLADSDEAFGRSKGTAERTGAFDAAADAARSHMLELNQKKDSAGA